MNDDEFLDFEQLTIKQSVLEDMFGPSSEREKVTVGRYELRRLIGAGMMGKVYRAYDPDLARDVAVKVVGRRGESKRQGQGDLLVVDAERAAKVEHPNVIEIYDVGKERGEIYVVMKLIEGEQPTLEKWLENSSRTWREVVEIFLQAGEGLAAAHRRSIVHCDFKLSNVLVDARGWPWVADFGLARVVDDPQITKPSEGEVRAPRVVGTPKFMAPECWQGAPGPLSDQYAFCVSLYHALFRTWPLKKYSVEWPKEGTLEESRVCEAASPWDRRGVPRYVEKIVLKGLASSPDDRFESMSALLERLRSALGRRQWVYMLSGGACIALSSALVVFLGTTQEPCSSIPDLWESADRDVTEAALWRAPGDHTEYPVIERLDAYAEEWTKARREVCEDGRSGVSTQLVDERRLACLERKRAVFSSAWQQIATGEGPVGRKMLEFVRQIPPVSDCGVEAILASEEKALAFAEHTDRSQSPQTERRWQELTEQLAEARTDGLAAKRRLAISRALAVEEQAARLGLRYLRAEALLVRGSFAAEEVRSEREWPRVYGLLSRASILASESGSARLAAEAYLQLAKSGQGRVGWAVLHAHLDTALALARSLPEGDGLLSLMARIEIARGDLWIAASEGGRALEHYDVALSVAGDRSDRIVAILGRGEALYTSGRREDAERVWRILGDLLEENDSEDYLLTYVYDNLSMVALSRSDYRRAQSLNESAMRRYYRGDVRNERLWRSIRLRRAAILHHQEYWSAAAPLLWELLGELEGVGADYLSQRTHISGLLVDCEFELERYERALEVAEGQLFFLQEHFPSDKMKLARARIDVAKAAVRIEPERARRMGEQAIRAVQDAPAEWPRVDVEFAYIEVCHDLERGDEVRRRLPELYSMLGKIHGSDEALQRVKSWARKNGYDGKEQE